MTMLADDPRPLKIFLVAGEPSGDVLGARLIRALRIVSDRPVEVIGVGGSEMEREGLSPIFPMEDLTAFGLAEVIPKIPVVLRRLSQTAAAALDAAPDAVVLIDAPGFNIRLAAKLTGRRCPLLQYVAPTVWAWKPGRARTMARYFDEVLCLFPFEPDWFQAHGLATTVVGHSVVESGAASGDARAFRTRHGIPDTAPLACLLPGSRRSEINRMLPVFGDVTRNLLQRLPDLRLSLPTLPALQGIIEEITRDWPVRPIVTTSENEKYDSFSAADVALAASGTVGLELALAETPHVIAYKVNPMTAWIARRVLTTKYANLVNVMFGKEVVPEFIQEHCTAALLVPAMMGLLCDEGIRSEQKSYLKQGSALLGAKENPPSIRAAKAILKRINS